MLRLLYTVLFYLVTPLILGRLCWRSIREPAYRADLLQRFGVVRLRPKGEDQLDDSRVIWVHAVSAGETIAAIPLINRLQSRGYRIVLTNMTPTGRERASTLLGDSVQNFYAPYDLPGAVARFLTRVQPQALVIIDTELWPNMIAGCVSRNIKVCLVNGRLALSSYEGYKRVLALSASMVKSLTLISVQTQSHADRFRLLGASESQVEVAGSIKFDQKLPSDFTETVNKLRSQIGDRVVVLGASTHAGEEAMLVEAVRHLNERILLILAPRHVHRADDVAGLLDGFVVHRRTDGGAIAADTEVMLLDTMGELTYFYGVSDIAVVGGSLVDVGGHNLMEAALAGAPIIMGPFLENIEDIAQEFTAEKAMIVVAGQQALSDELKGLVENPQARLALVSNASALMKRKQGALAAVTQRLCEVIDG